MPLQECMEAHTHRQYLAWLEWLGQQWNQPSRSDYYLMQIAQVVQQILSKNPVKLEQQKVKFTLDSQTVDRKTAAMWSKARWIAAFGGKVEIRRG